MWIEVTRDDLPALRAIADTMARVAPWHDQIYTLDRLHAWWRKPQFRLEVWHGADFDVILGGCYKEMSNSLRLLIAGWSGAIAPREAMLMACRRVADYLRQTGLPAYTILTVSLLDDCKAYAKRMGIPLREVLESAALTDTIAFYEALSEATAAAGMIVERTEVPGGKTYIMTWRQA